ncbi:glutamine amidotransferase-related protein [Amphritea balenae]|uniref:Glutamine amidotransferase n=1 Tax=Amphritea balenae TaxID=452629 RepID=A0A3P1SYQ3_9GAMM|nr:glutamine amidotransferase [Amphritea balenae]RRD01253.1 glutamine amidotransferase [Amphritea balenae]GGK58712.1 glutamine amidotransferase [Amphritea balenae]
MKIGILATGITPDELLGQHGSYADMFVQLFNQADVCFEYEVFEVRDDHFPASAEQCDGWIITGSKFNVDENRGWMQQLKELILEIDGTGKPLVGICFGHQIIAEAFKGKVEAFDGGWGVGLHSYQLSGENSFIKNDVGSFTISAMHRYQVTEKPVNARVFAESDFCKYAGLVYGDNILTFQAHPEFNVSYETELVALRKGEVIPDDTADIGLASLRQEGAATDSVQVAGWMADFIRQQA